MNNGSQNRYLRIQPRGSTSNIISSSRQDGVIGEGVYGVVYEALDTVTKRRVALKKIKVEHECDGLSASALREITILMQLQHENIVKLDNVQMEHHRLSLVFELIDMDLFRFMSHHELTPAIAQGFIAKLLSGVAYMHSLGVMHRDLKPQNILVSLDGSQLKIADFGLARTVAVRPRSLTIEVVTRWYRAPEIMLGHTRYNCSVDVWSAGCIMAEILHHEHHALLPGDSEIDQLHKVFRLFGTPNRASWPAAFEMPNWRTTFPQWPSIPINWAQKLNEVSPSAVELLEKMLVCNPAHRISARAALSLPYCVGALSASRQDRVYDADQDSTFRSPPQTAASAESAFVQRTPDAPVVESRRVVDATAVRMTSDVGVIPPDIAGTSRAAPDCALKATVASADPPRQQEDMAGTLLVVSADDVDSSSLTRVVENLHFMSPPLSKETVPAAATAVSSSAGSNEAVARSTKRKPTTLDAGAPNEEVDSVIEKNKENCRKRSRRTSDPKGSSGSGSGSVAASEKAALSVRMSRTGHSTQLAESALEIDADTAQAVGARRDQVPVAAEDTLTRGGRALRRTDTTESVISAVSMSASQEVENSGQMRRSSRRVASSAASEASASRSASRSRCGRATPAVGATAVGSKRKK